MKILLWIGGSPNHIALTKKISKQFDVVGVVIEKRKIKNKVSSRKLLEKIVEKVFLPKIGNSWKKLMNYYQGNYPIPKEIGVLEVENINCDETHEFSKELKPDLILVSGTSLIKDKLLNINPKIGILNLHTGLSPYIKGGPNCTNWCISTAQFNLIGNTIMWIDKGIDTGNILTSELTKFNGNESLFEIHFKVMEHAHELYINAINSLNRNIHNSVPQIEISEGRTYFTKEWGLIEKINLIRNLTKFRRTVNKKKQNKIVKTVEL